MNELDAVAQKRAPQVAVIPTSQATSLLQAITQAASNPATDIEKMERLFAMHQTMVKSEAETAFNAAMARAQGAMEPVIKNRRNEQTNSNYADLATINALIKPIYTDEGFSISFDTAEAPKPEYLRVIAILSHKQGHSRTYHLDLPPDEVGIKGSVNKTKVHATGSTNMYARRYLTCMAFNISTVDDTDGNQKYRTMPESQVADFKSAIEVLPDDDAAKTLWQAISKATTEAGDVAANDELRALMVAKRKTFKKQGAA